MCLNENGRSMIEMLGVLAIVGILSIGGISGFSKAMMKQKLNKQTEVFSLLFDSVDTYRDRLLREKLGSMDLVPVFRSMGEIPDGVVWVGNALYDGFSNQIRINTNNCPSSGPCTEISLRYSLIKQSDFAICNNILQIAIAHSASLCALRTATSVEDASVSDYGDRFWGDSYCSQNKKCIRDMSFSDIDEMCQVCVGKKTCSYIFLWCS